MAHRGQRQFPATLIKLKVKFLSIPYKQNKTTGLDPTNHELIELAIVLFAFERETGNVIGIIDEYVGQRKPYRSIPREATRINGITRDMVKGKTLDLARIKAIASRAEFYVAHNAEFDSDFAHPYLPRKWWLCSLSRIDWSQSGCKRRNLASLLEHHRIRTGTAHRAGDDAHALLQLLASSSPDGRTYLKILLTNAEYHSKHKIPSHKPPSHSKQVRRTPARSGTGCLMVALSWLGFMIVIIILVMEGI